MQQLPRGIRNNNPLNLIITNTPWLGKCTENTDGHFEQFIGMDYGLRAAMINARTIIHRHRRCTLLQFITTWAPPTENNTYGYTAAVATKAGIMSNHVLDVSKKNEFCRIIWAMAYVENGQEISFGLVENAYALAFRK